MIIQKYLHGFQGKQVKKHFVAEYAIQNHYNLGIWELKHKAHVWKKAKSVEASASNKVFHQETFTIPSYQVKKAEILLTVHSILTYTTQNNGKICKTDKSVVS